MGIFHNREVGFEVNCRLDRLTGSACNQQIEGSVCQCWSGDALYWDTEFGDINEDQRAETFFAGAKGLTD